MFTLRASPPAHPHTKNDVMQVARHRFRVCVKGLCVVARAVGIMGCDSSLDFFSARHRFRVCVMATVCCCSCGRYNGLCLVTRFLFVLLNRMHVVSSSLAP